jgi:AcrR family transcriptional regulator
VQDVTVAERWTQERRREHTRNLLLDAAKDVFARRGFEGASLEEIAEAAGYTRGAIYKHFGSKEELFLAVNKRYNESFLKSFVDSIDPATPVEELDLASLAKRWHEMQYSDPHDFALGIEFNLFVLRHPETMERVAKQRLELAQMIADFIDEQSERLGEIIHMKSLTLARLSLACSDGLQLAAFLDRGQDDLYEPFLALLVSAIEDDPTKKQKAKKTAKSAKSAKK